MHRVALGCHQGNEGVLVGGVFHALVNGVHEPQLPALTFQRCVIFRAAHATGLLRWRVKDRKTHLQTDLVVVPHQFLQLFLRHVQLFAGVEIDGVDDAVGVDVLPVYMGADQHLAAVKILRQLKGIGSNINRLTVLANMDKVQVIGLEKAAGELSEVSAALRSVMEGR